jgi:predicted GNAT family acetyltransferase
MAGSITFITDAAIECFASQSKWFGNVRALKRIDIMVHPTKLEKIATTTMQTPSETRISLPATPLTDDHETEALAFLGVRPLHTVVMTGFIRDNGLESPFNRGTFYGFRNAEGQLEGVALVGHVILVEARTLCALKAFARLAQNCPPTHMIMGEQEKVACFWSYYAEGGKHPRRICRELLLEQHWPVGAAEFVPDLRRATLDDLMLVMPVHASMAYEESGINPLEVDPQGFRLRLARRIEQGRVWVWTEGGRLIFKADAVADTPEMTYLEGVYVYPSERGRGYGLRCMSQLGRTLLTHTGAICLLVNERNQEALNLFYRAGYKLRSYYDTIFLQRQDEGENVTNKSAQDEFKQGWTG